MLPEPKNYYKIRKEITYSKENSKIRVELQEMDMITNIKGYELYSVITDPTSKRIVMTIKDNIILGKVIVVEQRETYIQHYQIISHEKDINIIIKKCEGCNKN